MPLVRTYEGAACVVDSPYCYSYASDGYACSFSVDATGISLVVHRQGGPAQVDINASSAPTGWAGPFAHFPGVRDAVALDHEDGSGGDQLAVCYATSVWAHKNGGAWTHAASRFPDHMKPAASARLDAQAVTPNGKLIRKGGESPLDESAFGPLANAHCMARRGRQSPKSGPSPGARSGPSLQLLQTRRRHPMAIGLISQGPARHVEPIPLDIPSGSPTAPRQHTFIFISLENTA